MRSKASASPCCALRMASASPNSRTSVGLVRATGPVGTHQLLSDAIPAPQGCLLTLLIIHQGRMFSAPARGLGKSRSFRRRLGCRLAAGRFHFGDNLRRTPILVQGWLGSERNYRLAKRRQLLDGQHAKKRFQHDGRFAKAGVQVVVKNLQACPLLPPRYSYPFADVPGRFTCFSLQPGDDFFQSAQLAEKTRARPKADKRQQIIGSRNLLGALASEEAGAQRSRIGEGAELPGVFIER